MGKGNRDQVPQETEEALRTEARSRVQDMPGETAGGRLDYGDDEEPGAVQGRERGSTDQRTDQRGDQRGGQGADKRGDQRADKQGNQPSIKPKR